MVTSASPINRHEFRFVGMSRSGNHAIINWILQQISGRYCFLNCVEPCQNPFASARPTGNNGASYESNYPLHLHEEQKGEHGFKDYLLYNYEDCYLGMVADGRFESRHDEWVGRSKMRRDVLILRDPFNLFASRLKSGLYGDRERSGEPNLVTPTQARRIWKQHAREYLEPGRNLSQRPLAISFNRWATERAYRKQIAEALDLPFADGGVDIVPATAGGSSFDGRRFNGNARSMSVSYRWRHYESFPAFWQQFDDQMLEYAERIFGSIPEPAKGGNERALADRAAM